MLLTRRMYKRYRLFIDESQATITRGNAINLIMIRQEQRLTKKKTASEVTRPFQEKAERTY